MSDTENTQMEQDESSLAGLREAARRGNAAAAENEALRRSVLFLRAGVDPESKIGNMLFKTWEGDDVEALKAEAMELGLLRSAASEKDEADAQAAAVRAAEDARRAQAADLTGNGIPAGADATHTTPHPIDSALTGYHDAISHGADISVARQDAVARVLGAAFAGDQRVLVNTEARLRAGQELDREISGRNT